MTDVFDFLTIATVLGACVYALQLAWARKDRQAKPTPLSAEK